MAKNVVQSYQPLAGCTKGSIWGVAPELFAQLLRPICHPQSGLVPQRLWSNCSQNALERLEFSPPNGAPPERFDRVRQVSDRKPAWYSKNLQTSGVGREKSGFAAATRRKPGFWLKNLVLLPETRTKIVQNPENNSTNPVFSVCFLKPRFLLEKPGHVLEPAFL